jgi:hypothetical protein
MSPGVTTVVYRKPHGVTLKRALKIDLINPVETGGMQDSSPGIKE